MWRAALMCLTLACAATAAPLSAPGSSPSMSPTRSSTLSPPIEPARAGTQCVEPPALMRRQHMDFLKHQRDATVHGGIRGAKHSLKDCVACHASRQTGSVAAAPTDFCSSCHGFAAVKIDCFECHASKPATAVAAQRP